MLLQQRIEKLIWKICKEKNRFVAGSMLRTIVHPTMTTQQKMEILSKNVNLKNVKDTSVSDSKSFIGEKIQGYLMQSLFQSFNTCTFMDIGGGNGDLMHSFSQTMHLPKEQLYSVESVDEWSEPYTFPFADEMQYLVFNDLSKVKDSSVDVLFLMVTLHHMTDETMHALMAVLERVAKPNALVMVKEHDCQTREDQFVIDWEHHLYHLVKSKNTSVCTDISEYLEKKYIGNFKPKEYFDSLFAQYHFHKKEHLNRFLGNTEDVNPTNLYWAVYVKK